MVFGHISPNEFSGSATVHDSTAIIELFSNGCRRRMLIGIGERLVAELNTYRRHDKRCESVKIHIQPF